MYTVQVYIRYTYFRITFCTGKPSQAAERLKAKERTKKLYGLTR